MFSGYKTYLAAAGLFGLALYQFSTGTYAEAWATLMAALAAVGLRHAVGRESPPPSPPPSNG